MSLDETLNIIEENRESIRPLLFLIKTHTRDQVAKCVELKTEYTKCRKGKYSDYLTCQKKYPFYEECADKMVKPEEFKETVLKGKELREKYEEYETKIHVCVMGPVFQKNDFEITIGSNRKERKHV